MLEAAVAVGTLLLAGATVWLGRQTKGSVRQSLLARLDQMAPAVLVTRAEILDTAVATAPFEAGSRVLPARREWLLSQSGDESLGVRCTISVANEGARSAMVRLVTADGDTLLPAAPSQEGLQAEVVVAYPVSDPPSLDLQSVVLLSALGQWTIIPPGIEAQFAVTYWAPAHAWNTEAQVARTDPNVERRRFVIEVKAGPASVLDRWEIEFYKLALWFDPTGRVIVASSDPTGMPAPFPGAAVTVGDMTREYPTREPGTAIRPRLGKSRPKAVGKAALRPVLPLFATRSDRGRDEAEAIGPDNAEPPGPGGGGTAAT